MGFSLAVARRIWNPCAIFHMLQQLVWQGRTFFRELFALLSQARRA
jgi:hypothetical protein